MQGSDGGLGRTITIRAAPFLRAERLRRFIDRVARLPGVRGAAAGGFRGGAFSLAVTYRDHVPLSARLATLAEFGLRVAADDGDTITVVLAGKEGQDTGYPMPMLTPPACPA